MHGVLSAGLLTRPGSRCAFSACPANGDVQHAFKIVDLQQRVLFRIHT